VKKVYRLDFSKCATALIHMENDKMCVTYKKVIVVFFQDSRTSQLLSNTNIFFSALFSPFCPYLCIISVVMISILDIQYLG